MRKKRKSPVVYHSFTPEALSLVSKGRQQKKSVGQLKIAGVKFTLYAHRLTDGRIVKEAVHAAVTCASEVHVFLRLVDEAGETLPESSWTVH